MLKEIIKKFPKEYKYTFEVIQHIFIELSKIAHQAVIPLNYNARYGPFFDMQPYWKNWTFCEHLNICVG